MRHAVSNTSRILLALALAGLLAVAPGSAVHAAPTAGVRITPAAIRLELSKNAIQTSAAITLTNTYAAPVSLHMSIQPSAQNVKGRVDPTTLVSLSDSDMTIGAGQAATETITLHDAKSLSPGSQSVDFIVQQRSTASTNGVGVQPAVRLPVTLIKDDGAITSLGLTSITAPNFTLQTPQTITVRVRNTGNMVTIPRGIVTIRDPRGVVIGQGVVNTASAAIVPGNELKMPVPITAMQEATAPGRYQVNVSYGAGGDAADKSKTQSYIFVAWWHGGLALLTILSVFAAVRAFKRLFRNVRFRRKKPIPAPAAQPAKRRILIGRNA